MSALLGDLRGAVGGVQGWVGQQWTQRVVQVSVYASIVFFLLSSLPLINWVEKNVWSVFGIKLGADGTRVLHAIIFGLFMYVGTRFILDPVISRVVEGNKGRKEHEEHEEE